MAKAGALPRRFTGAGAALLFVARRGLWPLPSAATPDDRRSVPRHHRRELLAWMTGPLFPSRLSRHSRRRWGMSGKAGVKQRLWAASKHVAGRIRPAATASYGVRNVAAAASWA